AFPRHPEIGANAGSLTSDDILALDVVCRENHVELVPNLQSLGHQRDLLNLSRYHHLAETPWNWTLAVGQEGTYQLLDELYGDLLPAFSSDWLNVDADEPYDVGRGQSKALTDELGPGRVYLRHIQRLHDLAAKHGKRLMMWADMFWHYPELIGEMPEDILFLDWWYEPKDRYATVDTIAKAGRPFYVCPGTSSWTSFFPRLDNAIHNIRTFVRDGVQAGAAGMLLTDWGDGGHYQPISNSWYPYLWGAECAWTGSATTTEAFDPAFSRLFVGDTSGQVVAAMHRLGNTMKNAPVWPTTWNTPMALWEDPIAGDLAEVVPVEVVTETRAAAENLFAVLDLVRDPAIRADLALSAGLIHFATNKVDMTRRIHQTLAGIASGDLAAEQGTAHLTSLIAALQLQRRIIPAVVAEFEQRWLAHARRSEIQVNLDRFAALLARYDVAIPWLEAQRDACAIGQPVDADLATYDRGDYAVLWQESKRNIENLVDLIGEQVLPPDIQLSLARLRERTAGIIPTAVGFQ
ncbi:MAG TPA: family 20 glycosylhydrolase, partial [Thermomicrobiales bacterium]|nr:family 20 glycosylhydrolase [Thermomicrobiales bacterium]